MARKLRLFDIGVWVLPWRVAARDGFFAEEGFEVEFVQGESDDSNLKIGTADLANADKEKGFKAGQIDVYSACEWGVIKRVVDLEAGKIIGNRRTSGASHSIYVLPGRGFDSPKDLARIPIAVNLHSGSYYTTLEGLEEFLKPEEIRTVHYGSPVKRYEALFTGKAEAASLMEPFSTLAEVQGAIKIAEFPGRGGWVGSEQLSSDEIAAFYRAVSKAVNVLNAQPEKYRDLLVNSLHDYGIDPVLVEKVREQIQIPRYLEPRPYERREFEGTYNWMVERNLIKPGVEFEQVVNAAVGTGIGK